MTTMVSCKKRHIPYRMCVVCRQMTSRSNLIRLVRSREGKILSNDNCKVSGKGIYICAKERCIVTFLMHKRFKKLHYGVITEETRSFLERLKEKI